MIHPTEKEARAEAALYVKAFPYLKAFEAELLQTASGGWLYRFNYGDLELSIWRQGIWRAYLPGPGRVGLAAGPYAALLALEDHAQRDQRAAALRAAKIQVAVNMARQALP